MGREGYEEREVNEEGNADGWNKGKSMHEKSGERRLNTAYHGEEDRNSADLKS